MTPAGRASTGGPDLTGPGTGEGTGAVPDARSLWDRLWTAVELDHLDHVPELLHPGVRFRTSSAAGEGPEYVVGVMRRHRAAYPDIRRDVVDVVESPDGGAVCVELDFVATHLGALLRPGGGRIEPTGRSLRWRAVDRVRSEGGVIVSWTAIFDRLDLLHQVS